MSGTPDRLAHRIIVYRCGTIGDTIVAVPAIHAIRNTYPDAALILMTASSKAGGIWADQVLREFGWFDEFLTYEPAELGTIARLWRLVRRVRAARADLVIHLGSERNGTIRIGRDRLFFRLAGIRRFIGCRSDTVTPWGRLKRRDAVYRPEVDRLLAGLRVHGINANKPVTFDLPITDAHRDRVSAFLERHHTGSRPLIALCPGAKQSAKRWPEQRYAEIGRRIIESVDADLVVVGGEDEARTAERIAQAWPAGRWSIAATHLNILESAELLRRCLFYVGNDTGAMHLAAAVGTRCIAVFAARCPERSWHPYGSNHIVLRRHVPCRNCYLSDCTTHALRCLTDIHVEDVWSACQRALIFH